MQHNDLLNAIPELIALVRRDGSILSLVGGKGLEALQPTIDGGIEAVQGSPKAVWSSALAALVGQLARKCIARRGAVESQFHHLGVAYEIRAHAQGPDRAICVIRPALLGAHAVDEETASGAQAWRIEPREFKRRFKESISLAALREVPIAVSVMVVDGVADIASIADAEFAATVLQSAIARLSPSASHSVDESVSWYLSYLGDQQIAVVLNSGDRDAVEATLKRFCERLNEPIVRNDATFHLTAWAGVAILGQDASTARQLIEHARSAANEARRLGAKSVQCFSETIKLRSLARLDIARELRLAIANRDIHLRYVGRHDLESGRVTAAVGYFQWEAALRGAVRAAEFVKVAETTGLARVLSRTALERLGEDYAALRLQCGADARISFGPLRHHVLHDQFLDDITEFLKSGVVPPDRFELRIGERFFTACDPQVLRSIAELGVSVIIEDVGYGASSLECMASAPIVGLQLGLSWVTKIRRDPIARKLAHAAINMAAALGIKSIAKGVDDLQQRELLLTLDCREGLGHLYGELDRSAHRSNVALQLFQVGG